MGRAIDAPRPFWQQHPQLQLLSAVIQSALLLVIAAVLEFAVRRSLSIYNGRGAASMDSIIGK